MDLKEVPESSAAPDQCIAVRKLRAQAAASLEEVVGFRGEHTVFIGRRDIVPVLTFLRDDQELRFEFLADLTAVDYLPRKPRFEVVYHLKSLSLNHRLRVKTRVPDDDPVVDTVVGVWPAANWLEREVFDMFGIQFRGHPDPRRILMPDEWKGHPLRKDFPIGKVGVNFDKTRGK